MKKTTKQLGALLVLGTAAIALAQGTTFLTIGSGSTTGVYFPVATGMAKMVNDAGAGVRANARSTGGSVFNVNAIATGELDAAVAQNDVVYYAYKGTGLQAFQGKANAKLRTMAVLYPEVLHVVARKDSGIRSIADLKGKRVVIGDLGSGTELTAKQVLESYGLGFDDLGQALRVSPAQGITLMQDKRADALFYTVGVGASAISQIAQTVDVAMVPVGGNQASSLIKKYPFYVRYNIPAKSYKGVGATVPSVAVQATLVTSTAVSDDAVYKAMKAIFDDEGALKAIHPSLATNFSYAKAVKGIPAPLHAGAVKFFKEKGLNVK
ncbi:TAXI family TRAP transporter solute-binding subunit [Deinococcus soli (ex Cha et al. 2016)]|uniref:TRAP transporter TAXI family solute receptor n=2 Tax=Deinococcus soli (ex Cha et al. 2016) TaxID=1309411 RepID=A0ACC6KD01_9DEIO|nr:TAXI family TRAP transporter solute-binding subunit [Deinococcus soli (ex Cha et al. 2016)]MDR6217540.1 TRAP transporter TAXI family solute receptor [Deinococcus soli (ex Cha et al. 2016)]MDR6326849.1 TRAP transporter TAXI family solute receptor [Deinococcus soli (ex Cha et al. 2016)]MDR6750425.1 TRAP transporter TAXI family solute receptor [Deinococcus soli (ex Cha et al. 2016)]